MMALAAWSLWVRSLSVIDLIDFPLWGSRNRIAILDGCVGWDHASRYVLAEPDTAWATVCSDGTSMFDLITDDVDWQLRGFGFARGQLQAVEGIVITVTILPCLWFAVPLTLLSAGLILWPIRKRANSPSPDSR